jgi:hypothetical protein
LCVCDPSMPSGGKKKRKKLHEKKKPRIDERTLPTRKERKNASKKEKWLVLLEMKSNGSTKAMGTAQSEKKSFFEHECQASTTHTCCGWMAPVSWW